MQHRINKSYFLSHYFTVFIILKFYIDFLQKLRKIEKVHNFDDNHNLENIYDSLGVSLNSPILTVNYTNDDEVEKQRFADMDRDIQFSIGDTSTTVTDTLDRVDHIKEDENLLVSYTYEGKGKVKEKHFQDILRMRAVFDDGRRPISIAYKYKDTNVALIERSMDWNLVDLKKHDNETGKKQAFTYDSAYRLREVDDAKENKQYEYEIDGIENVDQIIERKEGQSETKGAVYNNRHQKVAYDGLGLTYDNNGNLTHFNHDYVYNWKNQLVKVITGTGVNVEYKYDALGRRREKVVRDPNSESVTRYIHDGYQVIEERDDNDHVQYRYTYGNGIDERLEMEKNIDGTFKRFFLLHDSIGNVIGLTNDRGHLIERYNYTPFGEVTYFNSENAPEVDSVRIEDGKIKIRFNRPVILDNLYINLIIKATQEQISGSKSILNMDRDIEFNPPQIPQDETLTIKIDAMDDLSGSPDQPIQLLSKDFVYQGEALLLIHDHGPPMVERILYEDNALHIDFNEEIDPASVTDSVEIEYGSNIINGSIEVTGDNQVKFTPDENLSDNQDYEVRVKDIKDTAGKAVAIFTWDFELNQQKELLFSYSILAKNNHSIVGNNSLMHGRIYEPEIGLYYYRNRYYHPELGRFLQQDPNGYEDSLNLYQAFNMNPVNFVDPMGLTIKLSPKEMYDFKEKLYRTIDDLYYQKYAIEQNNFKKYKSIMRAVIGYDLKTLVGVFNKETELNLEVPEEMGFLDRIFGTSKSFFSMSKKVGEKVRKFFGSEEAQERIKNAPNHWLVQEGVCLPGLLTIGDQLNLAFANGAGSFAEFTTEEIQWIMVAGVLKGGIKYIDEINDAIKARKFKKIKSINLPSWKKIKIDIEHIASGHMKGGSRVSDIKDLFPEYMTKKQIENNVRQAYRYGKRLKTQGSRAKIVGEYGGITIEMWVDLDKKIIESAWPLW